MHLFGFYYTNISRFTVLRMPNLCSSCLSWKMEASYYSLNIYFLIYKKKNIPCLLYKPKPMQFTTIL